MLVRLNTALRNAILDAIFNGGSIAAIFDNGTVTFRTGATPAADAAASGTVVATVALPADAMAAAANGSVAKNAATWQDVSADNPGTMAHARWVSSDGTKVLQCDVTASGGGGAMTVDNPTLVAGQSFNVTGCTVTMPSE